MHACNSTTQAASNCKSVLNTRSWHHRARGMENYHGYALGTRHGLARNCKTVRNIRMTRTAGPSYEIRENYCKCESRNDSGALPDCDAVTQSKRLHLPGWRKSSPAESIQAQSKRGGDVPEDLTIPRSPPRMLKSKRPKHTITKVNQS